MLGLACLGDVGLSAPVVAVGLGLAIPALAGLGQALLAPCVILMLAMSVCLVEPGRLRWGEMLPPVLLGLSNLLLTPLLVHVLFARLGMGEACGWLVLVAACPAAGAAALVAGLLRLPVRPMLLAQLLCFFAMPLAAPIVAALVLEGTVVSPLVLLERVALMVALSTLLGLGLRRVLGEARRTQYLRPLRGAGVLGLCGVGLAISGGLPVGLAAGLDWSLALLGLAMVSAVGALLGLLAGLACRCGIAAALALGGAVRNVSLLWSATIGIAPPDGEMMMQMATFWTILLPFLLGLRDWVPRLIWRRRGQAAAALLLLAVG